MQALDLWHDIMSERNPDRLSELLAEDCVFLSPVVHTPQQGREITTLYLTAAMHVLGEDFEYVKEIVDEPHAVLEFVSNVDGISINGIDMMTVNDEGKVCEFKVMVRPLKAVNMLHAKMREMLEQVKA
jgi:hypothetical protein